MSGQRAIGTLEKQSFELDWTPICDRQGRVEKITLCLRDVSEIRALQSEAQQHEEDIRILQEIIDIPEDRFQRFLTKTQEYLKENRERVLHASSGKKHEIIRQLFMNMHTIKGTARSFYLKAISDVTHAVEQDYANMQTGKINWDTSRLLCDLDRIQELIHHYKTVGVDKLGWALGKQLIKLPRRALLEQLNLLRRIEPILKDREARKAAASMSSQLARQCHDSVQALLDEAMKGLDSIARHLSKAPPSLNVDAPEVFLTDEGADLVTSILTHIFRNSIDHGIEEPTLREATGKPAAGTIHFQARFAGERLVIHIHIHDDGRGLNLVSVEQKARDLGLITDDKGFAPAELSPLIFIPGISTKDVVTEISGRGVGLDVVKVYLESAGGSIDIELMEGSGHGHAIPFRFLNELPPTAMFKPLVV